MAVPNTNTFSLSDVITEIGGVTDSLADCFSNANSAGFDPAYSGSKNSLLNFRNYKHTFSLFTMNSLGEINAVISCGLIGVFNNYYHDGASSYPALNDKVYTSSTGPLFNGDNKYYLMSNNKSIRINNLGLIIDIYTC